MKDEELRIWAVEQAVKHHAGNGVTFEHIMASADKLIAYVRPAPKKAD
jgi:hypothetical protein